MDKQRLFSNERLIRLIIPLVIEQGLTILVGMCDGIMVSSVGEAAISGVSLVDMINAVVLTLFAGIMVSSVGEAAISGVSLVDMINAVVLTLFAALATGGAVVTSQFLGARQEDKARRSAGQLVLMSLGLGLAATVLCLVFARGLLKVFFGSIEAPVMAAGLTYLRITALSFPFTGDGSGPDLSADYGAVLPVYRPVQCRRGDFPQHRKQQGVHAG